MADIINTKQLNYSADDINVLLSAVSNLETTVKGWILDAIDEYKESLLPPRVVIAPDGERYSTLSEAFANNEALEIIVDSEIDGGSAIALTSENAHITLAEDVTVSAASIGRAFHVQTGSTVIDGDGIITNDNCENINPNTSVIRVGSNTSEATLTIGEDVKIESDQSYVVSAFGTNKATILVKGTIESKMSEHKSTEAGAFDELAALSGNGSLNLAETDITIDSGASVIADKSYAIYLPQAGVLNIKGTVSGYGGIEIKSGTLNIYDGAKITATASEVETTTNTDGCSTRGYAIAIVEHNNYKGNIVVNISGGEIIGKVEKFTDISYAEGKAAPIINITGGKFSLDPSALLSSTYEAVLEGDWYVVKQKVSEGSSE